MHRRTAALLLTVGLLGYAGGVAVNAGPDTDNGHTIGVCAMPLPTLTVCHDTGGPLLIAFINSQEV